MSKILLTLFLLATVAACSQDYRDYGFTTIDCSKKTTAKLEAPQGNNPVVSINLPVEGKVNGKGVLDWEGGGKAKEISGRVNLNWGGDWYQRDCRITYTPTGTTPGELRVYYRFNTL